MSEAHNNRRWRATAGCAVSLGLVAALTLTPATAQAAAAKPTAAAIPDKCSDVYFIGARGGGDLPGYDATIGTHFTRYRNLIQAALGSEAVDDEPVDYPVVGDPGILVSLAYGASVAAGVGDLTKEFFDEYHRCKGSRQVFALAGYSQGAQIVNTFLDTLRSTPLGRAALARIAVVTLYGDPRRANLGLPSKTWEIGENSRGDLGGGSRLLGYPPFAVNPLPGTRLQSFCNEPAGPEALADPVCAFPREYNPTVDLPRVLTALKNSHVPASYIKNWVDQGASTAAAQTLLLLGAR